MREYATIIGQIWTEILEIVVQTTDSDQVIETSNFVKMIVETLSDTEPKNEQQKISLALNVLESIQEYYSFALRIFCSFL